MNYKNYQKSRNAVWQLLIDCEIKELPIKITDICKQIGIPVKFADLQGDSDGYTFIYKGQPIIVINSNCTNICRLRFTVAHELGHIILGHIGKYALVNREPSPNDNPIEQEANIFASRLLAPACVLWGCEVECAEDIMKLCDISFSAAQFRMERMKELYARDKFLTSPLERKVFDNFKEFIIKYSKQS
jgi:Zn-dependent peptidase ImmA (M78 family)